MSERRNRLVEVLRDHARIAWDAEAVNIVFKLPIIYSDIGAATAGLCVPAHIPFDPDIPPQVVDCFGVSMTMLHPFALADFPDFQPVPGSPWLWRSNRGTLMLAFNIAGFLQRFIDFEEERAIGARDEHGRLPYEASTLCRLDVAHLPLLNTYLFAILAVAKAHGSTSACIDPSSHVLPPVLVLSHDCDQLRGNDWITQAIRLYRFLAPLKRLRPPAISHLRHIFENALFPRKHYFDDALAMSDAERRHGFRSAFYFLNGAGGRMGARSGSDIIAEFAKCLPQDAEIGVHYNYRHALDGGKLAGQIRELETLTGRKIQSGRAHYLVLDCFTSFDILHGAGIRTDESLGFSNKNAFRVGFAGAFRTWSGLKPDATPIVEIPLHFMDANTAPRNDAHDLLRMAAEVEKVGGIVTILYHPGAFDTPEAKDLRGVYAKYLAYFQSRGYRSLCPSEVGDLLLA